MLVEQLVQAVQLGRLGQKLIPHQAQPICIKYRNCKPQLQINRISHVVPELVAVSGVADAEARDGPAGLVVQVANVDDDRSVLNV